MSGDWSKLPRWAQEELRLLSGRVATLSEQLDTLTASADDEHPIRFRLPAGKEWRALPSGCEVRFRDGRGWVAMSPARPGERGVVVRSERTLHVRMQAANTIVVTDSFD